MKVYRILYLIVVLAILLMQAPGAVWAISCDVFTVTPTTAAPGDNVTLDWVTTDASEVNIDAIGAVATSGSEIFVVPNLLGPFSFILEAFDGNISEPNYAYCSAELTIEGPAVCDYFYATPDTLDGLGDVTLEWGTTGADISVSIDNGIGVVAPSDMLVVPVSSSTTFTLTADGTFGSAQCSVPVTVSSSASESGGGSGGGGKSINPKCEVMVDAPEVSKNGVVQVSWKGINAESFVLSAIQGGQSSIILSTTSKATIANGSLPFVVSNDTTFKVEVSKPNRSSDCVATVIVKPNNINGAIAGETGERIPLVTLPVTGLDPTIGFLVIFNLFLAFGAAMGAYVVVIVSQQFRRATDRSFTDTHLFTPLNALFSQERRSLHSRIILWQWLVAVLVMIFVAVLWSIL